MGGGGGWGKAGHLNPDKNFFVQLTAGHLVMVQQVTKCL